MNYNGIIVGIITFFLIGLFHPIVIKAEYYFSKKIWPIFGIIGFFFVGSSIFVKDTVISILLAVIGITCLWSIIELHEQEKRVKKGWFAQNPNREKKRREEV